MELLTYIGTLKALKMIVLSNMFRGGHPQQHMGTRGTNATMEQSANIATQSSLRTKLRSRTRSSFNEKRDMVEASHSCDREKRLSSSVDAIITKRDVNSKVICSAKGLLETNLDDLFNDVHRLDGWVDEPKSTGASVPTLSSSDSPGATVKPESLVSGDDTADDTATDSDSLDEAAREQRKCMGARRFGHMLRRVISRNGKLLFILHVHI